MIRSSHGSTLLRRLLIGAIVLLVPVLAGCEAGDDAPTLEFHPAANGGYATADAISVDNAFILGGPDGIPLAVGSSASMFLYTYNGGGSADNLVSVSAPGRLLRATGRWFDRATRADGRPADRAGCSRSRAHRADQDAGRRPDRHGDSHVPEPAPYR